MTHFQLRFQFQLADTTTPCSSVSILAIRYSAFYSDEMRLLEKKSSLRRYHIVFHESFCFCQDVERLFVALGSNY